LCEAETLITFGEGDAVAITTEERPLRFLLISGKPVGEPVAWVRPHRNEHPGATANSIRGVSQRDVYQASHRVDADALSKAP